MSLTESPGIDSRLLESEERYRAVIDNASDMIQSVRPDGTFEFVSKAWLDKLGYTREEVAEVIMWDIVYPEALEHCQILFMKAVMGEQIDSLETVVVTKDGKPVRDGAMRTLFALGFSPEQWRTLDGSLEKAGTGDYHPEQQSYLRTRERSQGVFLDGVENRTGRRSP